ANAFADLGRPAVIVGMDTPQVSTAALHAALRALESSGAVLGPAADGGYWAIGLREPDSRALLGVPMSSPHTLEAQRRRLRAVGPVLDVGCGPGRHVLALARRGVLAVGVDVTPAAVRYARARGAPVFRGSVFAAVPGVGHWRTALLLDGNIGIGGRPVVLLE